MEITSEIVKMAEKELDKELDEAVFLHLMDHISFAVSRMKQGLLLNACYYGKYEVFIQKNLLLPKRG